MYPIFASLGFIPLMGMLYYMVKRDTYNIHICTIILDVFLVVASISDFMNGDTVKGVVILGIAIWGLTSSLWSLNRMTATPEPEPKE